MALILFTIILFVSITLHEYSHGLTANLLGDPTAKSSGRLTLKPLAQIDLFGTIVLPFLLLMLSAGAFSFGYAKPIPINPYHFKDPKKDILWVGLAGPVVNFLIAFFLILILKISNISFLTQLMTEAIIINLVLATFNLVPIPPLDGSRVLSAVLPYKITHSYSRMETTGSFIIISLILLGSFRWLILPIVTGILSIFNIQIS
jgi:Zn-dependent protease